MADLSSLNMTSGRDPEDVYASVEARGRALRNRRYAALGAAATVLAIAIAVPVASALSPNGGRNVDVATQPGDTTTTTTAGNSGDDTTTTTAAPSTTAPSTTTTTTKNTTATTTATAPTTTTTAPRYEPCALDAIEATVTTDRPSYPIATPVAATGTLRNTSDKPCHMPAFSAATVYNRDDEAVQYQTWTSDTAASERQPTMAGSTRTYNWTWNQQACSYTQGGQCGQANPGDYTIKLTWGSYPNTKHAISAPFAITAA